MSTGLLFQNIVNYCLQIGMLVGVAAVVPAVLRLRQPGAKLVYWQILLAACLLLPLQPWKQVVYDEAVQVTTVYTTVTSVVPTTSRHLPPRSEMALMVLLAGAAVRLGWLAVGFWKLRRYRRHSQPLEPAPTWSVEASLLVSEDVGSPVTFGWRKPVVLLPASFPTLDARVQEAILCHEVMHVRRRDWLFTVAEELVRALFWFHPAIWWLLGEIGLAREQEVDRLAIEITKERDEYMDALLAIAGARSQLDLAPAPLFLRKRHLKHRVVLILKEAHMSQTRLISTLATGLGILAMACWLVTGAFPLTAQPQIVNDAPGVTVNLGGATLMHRTGVNYPPAALRDGVQGNVQVEVRTDGSGNVIDAKVLSGPDPLHRAVQESVLQWHFGRDAANTTRVVQIGFELPKPGSVETVVGTPGVVSGVLGGVIGRVTPGVTLGVVGGVPAGAGPREPVQVFNSGTLPSRISSIQVSGLPEQAKAELLATLPVHEGDELTSEAMQRATQAAKSVDEHLTVQRTFTPGPNGTQMGLMISVPGNWAMAPAPPPPTFSTPVNGQRQRVSGAVQAANILSKVQPIYPELAKTARVSGVVHLAAVIGADGHVQELHSLGGPALLVQAAMDAVKEWVYQATPTAVETTIDVNFTLNQ